MERLYIVYREMLDFARWSFWKGKYRFQNIYVADDLVGQHDSWIERPTKIESCRISWKCGTVIIIIGAECRSKFRQLHLENEGQGHMV